MDDIITVEEAIEMQGTEFYYHYSDGEHVKAYVKKFDPEVGLTCMTLETSASRGWTGNPDATREADGTWCIIGFDFQNKPELLRSALEDLTQIKKTGHFRLSRKEPICHFGSPNCSFI